MAKKKTHEEFIMEMEKQHPTILVLGGYKNTHSNIDLKCRICGYEWQTTPHNLLYGGTGCPKCAGVAKITPEEFKSLCLERQPDVIVLGTYISSATKIDVRCKKCGFEWNPYPRDLLRGHGCPQCAGNMKKSHEKFLAEMKEKHPNIVVFGKYINNRTSMNLVCKICGHEWKATPHDLLQGQGCPKCRYHIVAKKLSKSNDQYVQEATKINPNISILGEYINSKTKMPFRCNVCGYEWQTYPTSILNGQGCPRCAGNARKTTADFINEMNDLQPSIEVIGEYRGNKDKISVRCKNCGYKWQAIPTNILRGHGCPKCHGGVGKNHEQFIAEMHVKQPNLEIIGEYVRDIEKIKIRCKVCGTEWESQPSNLLQGHGCPQCAIKKNADLRLIPEGDVKQRFQKKRPDLKILHIERGMRGKITVESLVCHHTWTANGQDLLRRFNCPICMKHLHTSFPEQAIYFYVKQTYPMNTPRKNEQLHRTS